MAYDVKWEREAEFTPQPIPGKVYKKQPFIYLTAVDYKDRLSWMAANMDKIVAEAVRINNKNIGNIVRNRLYNEGTDANEAVLKRREEFAAKEASIGKKAHFKLSPRSYALHESNNITIAKKTTDKIVGGHEYIDLHRSGNFYASMFVTFEDGKILVDSNDFKKQKILNEYGPEAYQLTNKEIDYIYTNFIDPHIQAYFDAYQMKPTTINDLWK